MEYKDYVGLFVPGHRPSELERAFRMAVPSLTVDLFKTVPEQERLSTAYLVAVALEEFADRDKRTVLWIPFQSTSIIKKELALFNAHEVDRIRISSVRTSEDLLRLETIIDELDKNSSIPGIELVVDNIETFNGLDKICKSGRYLKSITIGVFDLWQSLSSLWKSSENLRRIKCDIVHIAKAYKLVPIDSINVNYFDLDRFAEDCRISYEMGFYGRPVIHPSQIKISMKIYNGGG